MFIITSGDDLHIAISRSRAGGGGELVLHRRVETIVQMIITTIRHHIREPYYSLLIRDIVHAFLYLSLRDMLQISTANLGTLVYYPLQMQRMSVKKEGWIG